MKGLNDMMKQAQAMQQKMQDLQNEIASTEVTGESGAGMVRLVMTGRYDVRKVEIDDGLMTEEKEILEDLVAAAMNDAVRKVEQLNQEKMSDITGGLDLPAGLKMPF